MTGQVNALQRHLGNIVLFRYVSGQENGYFSGFGQGKIEELYRLNSDRPHIAFSFADIPVYDEWKPGIIGSALVDVRNNRGEVLYVNPEAEKAWKFFGTWKDAVTLALYGIIVPEFSDSTIVPQWKREEKNEARIRRRESFSPL